MRIVARDNATTMMKIIMARSEQSSFLQNFPAIAPFFNEQSMHHRARIYRLLSKLDRVID